MISETTRILFRGRTLTLSSLNGCVGVFEKNDFNDIRLIQQLLNHFIDKGKLIPLRQLGETGTFSGPTDYALRKFQQQFVKGKYNPGKIDRGDQTFRQMLEMLLAPAPPKARVLYGRIDVSDPIIKKVLQNICDFFQKDVRVTSGDRKDVPKGGSPNSLHLFNRAADFHVVGLTDSQVFKELKENVGKVLEPNERYEVIYHGTHTATSAAHLHIGRYGEKGQSLANFKTEGLQASTRGKYQIEVIRF